MNLETLLRDGTIHKEKISSPRDPEGLGQSGKGFKNSKKNNGRGLGLGLPDHL